MKICLEPSKAPEARYSGLASVAALALTLAFLGLPTTGKAQIDNFDDGDDAGWTHNDPLGGLGAGPHATFSFPFTPGGQAYRIQASGRHPALPGAAGPGRAGSLRSEVYSRFHVSVDVIDWDSGFDQAFGILARINAPGLGTTDGYAFTYQTADSDVQISRITDESPSQVPGTLKDITLDPNKDYRFVFIGNGSCLEGRIYDLEDLSTPLIVVRGTDTTYTSGVCGMVVFDNGNGLVGADATYDNYCATTDVMDDFNDGNDTAPAPAWAHYDPFQGPCAGVAPPAGFTFPGGNSYRIFAPVPFAQTPCGPARAASTKEEAIYKDFYVSVDVLDFDDTVRQAFGILARVSTPGLGTTDGYLFSWEPGGGSLPGTSNGDLDISRIVDEVPIGQIETASSGLHLDRGKDYRFVFLGSGNKFEGQVYELPNTSTPLIRLPAEDPDNLYPMGTAGILSASQGSYAVPGDATFDNYYSAPGSAEPRLAIALTFGAVEVSWSANLGSIFELEGSPEVGPGASWTPIAFGDLVLVGSQLVYTVPSPVGNQFYRLVKK